MGSKGGDQTTISEPWIGQQPYLQQGFGQALTNLQTPPNFYPGATYVPFSQQTEHGLGMLQNTAYGTPVTQGLSNYVTDTLGGGGGFGLQDTASGQYLNANPHLDQMFGEASRAVTDQFNESVMPGINATFGQGGQTGSELHALTTGRAAGDLSDSLAGMAANIYGGNYMQERQNQLAAQQGLMGNQARVAGMAPMAYGLDMAGIENLLNVGSQVEGKAGDVLQDSINRFNFGQNLPDQQLSNYLGAIRGNHGGTVTQQVESNPLAGAAGGALTAYGLGSSVSGLSALAGPWGLLGGALLGYLGSR